MKSTQLASTPRPRRQLVFFLLSLFFALSIPLISLARDIDLSESTQRRYPFRAELSKVLQLKASERVMVTDLDRNGVSELVFYPARQYVHQHGPLQLALYTVVSEQIQMIQQEPILGPVVPTAVREMDVLEAPGNELVITYLRNNELRCRIWNYQRVIRRDYLLYRRHTTSDSVWDAAATPVAVLDANFDGKNEILFYFYAGYAHMPRGWLLLAPETGTIVQKAYFGGPPNADDQCLARDFDDDGHLELVLGTNAPENHFELNGVSDVWVYVLAYDLVTGEREFSKIMGPFYGGAKILGPGPTPDTWITSYHGMGGSVRPSRSRLSLFRWKSTVPVRELPFTSRFSAYRGPDYDGDGADDIYCVLMDKMEFWVVSNKLSVLAKAPLKNPPQGSLPGPFFEMEMADVDLDGQKEIILNLGKSLYILNKNLKPVAAIREPKQTFCGVFGRGTGEPPFLVTEDWLELGDRKVHLWRLEPTPVLARYAPSRGTIYALLATLFVAGAVSVFSALRRAKLRGRLLAASLEASGIQAISVDSQGRVRFSWGEPFLPVTPGQQLHDFFRAQALQTLSATVDEWRHTGRLTRTILTVLPPDAESPLLVRFETAPRDRQLLLIVSPSERTCGAAGEQWRALAQYLVAQLEEPVAAVSDELERLQSGPQRKGKSQSAALRQALAQVRRLQAALKRFAKLVNPARRDLQPQNLHDLVEKWSSRRKAILPRRVELVVEVPEGLPPVTVDVEQLVEVLDNLLENAVQAMPDGGLVRVSARHVHGLQREGDPKPRDYVVVEVKDSGKGIPADLLGKIFEPGFTTSSDAAGMGLFIVRKIAQDHGGFVDVSSAPEVGTIVSVYLPVEHGA